MDLIREEMPGDRQAHRRLRIRRRRTRALLAATARGEQRHGGDAQCSGPVDAAGHGRTSIRRPRGQIPALQAAVQRFRPDFFAW